MEKFKNKIICGDCIDILSKQSKPFADLIFADPPFNIGYKYDKYHDKVKSKNYIAWTKDWMTACKNILKPTGSFYIAIGDDYAANVKIIADELNLTMRNWIIWHYTFGQQTKTKFARAHTHIFYFTKDPKNYTFNDHAIRVPSDRQLIYNDKRAHSKGKMPDDVWSEYPRVCGTFKERQQWHPCQMPENLLKRIITVSSNPGDLVLDPFIGSGTTAAAAYQLDRNYAGFDISENYVENSIKRLADLEKQKAKNNGSENDLDEAARLLTDMKMTTDQIINCKKTLNIFTNQLCIRTNNKTNYSTKQVVSFLSEIQN